MLTVPIARSEISNRLHQVFLDMKRSKHSKQIGLVVSVEAGSETCLVVVDGQKRESVVVVTHREGACHRKV